MLIPFIYIHRHLHATDAAVEANLGCPRTHQHVNAGDGDQTLNLPVVRWPTLPTDQSCSICHYFDNTYFCLFSRCQDYLNGYFGTFIVNNSYGIGTISCWQCVLLLAAAVCVCSGTQRHDFHTRCECAAVKALLFFLSFISVNLLTRDLIQCIVEPCREEFKIKAFCANDRNFSKEMRYWSFTLKSKNWKCTFTVFPSWNILH